MLIGAPTADCSLLESLRVGFASCFLSFLLKVINTLIPTITHSKTVDSLLQPLGLGLLGKEVSS